MENFNETDIINTLVVGTLVMFLLTSIVIFVVTMYQKKVLAQKETLRLVEKKFQNELLDATIISSEKEREAIAKNMHDEMGTLISVILLNNKRLLKNLSNEHLSLELINTNNQLLREIDESVKTISNDLMSPTLSKLGLIKGINQLCSHINNSNAVKICVDSKEINTRFTDKIEKQLFRICKEILNNIIKHSDAKEIWINIDLNSTLLTISIKYNGKGLDDKQVRLIMENNKGLGLKSIYSRVQILDGKLNYFSEGEKNSLVTIQIPINKEL